MSEEQLEREVLSRVELDRRSFVKRVVLGTSFAVPVVASFQMDALTMNSASALVPNQTIAPGVGEVSPVQTQSGTQTSTQTSNQNNAQSVVVEQQQRGAAPHAAGPGPRHGTVSRRVFVAGPRGRRRAFLVRDTRLAATGFDAWILGLAAIASLIAGLRMRVRRVTATTPDSRK
jgi:hypothetical protein